jgi:dipeptidyl aminopeptidase/acylaminoacyl peptidase
LSNHGVVTRVVLAVGVVLVLAGCAGSTSTRLEPGRGRLVYVAGYDAAHSSVWVAKTNGAQPRRLGRGSLAVLSPDGRTVAVQRRGSIYVLSTAGDHARLLTRQRLRPEAWTPDGKAIVATQARDNAVVRLVAIDKASGRARTIASGSLYGFSFSPDGSEIAYSRAPSATINGICGDQFDIYTAKLSGGEPKRLTRDGVSAFPIWGAEGIAFSHFPGATQDDCASPGIWTMHADGSHVMHVVDRAPAQFATVTNRYGLEPLGWLDKTHILVGIRSEWGTQGAVLDTKTADLRTLENDYVEKASRDGRFAVGSGGDEGVDLTIVRISDGHQLFVRHNACCPDWNR